MRVLSLAPTSFFGDYGCHVRILEEARALKALGHTVTIVTYYKGSDVPEFRVIRSSPTPWHSNYEVGSSRHKFAFDALLALRLLRVLAREKFDVIHAHLHEGALIGGVLGKLWRVPVCLDYQGSLTEEMTQHGFLRNGRALALFKRVEALAEHLPQAIFTSTQHAAEHLKTKLGQPAKPVHHLPDGVNAETFRPNVISAAERAHLRARFGIAADQPVVVFVGLLAHHQGVGNLIEAAAQLKQQGSPARWLVMGYPNVRAWREQAVQHGVGDTVTFTGRMPYGDLPRMLALGDVAVAPKLSYTEGSGKLLNYMAMALPTVAFDTPAQREILGPLGIYAPMGDSAALAQQVLHQLNQPEQRRALGDKLRQRARQLYGWDRNALLMQSVYQQLVPQPLHLVAERNEL
jgi:glycosyltransferase involved in cell wall biosynthesis